MPRKHDRFCLPGLNWLGATLSRKMATVLVILAVLGWVFSFIGLLHDIQHYLGGLYDQAADDAKSMACQVTSFLEGSRGSLAGLEDFLEAHGLSCSLQDRQGEVLYQYISAQGSSTHLTASSTAEVLLPNDQLVRVQVWSPTLSRADILASTGHKVFLGLALFNLSLFLAAGILLYLFIISPINCLRRTMQDYSEHGTMPPRSARTDEVGRLQNTFADLAGELQAKEQSEHRLIASISHDLKTPLTSVLGYSERLMSARLSQEKREQYVHSIHDKGLAIKSILDEFDDYLEAGLRGGSPMERVTAQQLCSTLRKEYEGELADAGISFSVHCTCPQASILCNTPHLARYFGNLIGNSIRHAQAEHLSLSVLFRQEHGFLVLDFRDNGAGVPAALLGQIFEPLYTTDRGRKVSGLGLSICRSIIRAHGGSISASNHPEGGLLVEALIPLAGGKK